MGLPFSVALLTGLHLRDADLQLLREIVSLGGAVVSHSVHHYPNWGDSYEAALQEATESRAWLQRNVPGDESGLYAVSPFHQNPPYAVNALADGGYQVCGKTIPTIGISAGESRPCSVRQEEYGIS
jgi:hypothetical protein